MKIIKDDLREAKKGVAQRLNELNKYLSTELNKALDHSPEEIFESLPKSETRKLCGKVLLQSAKSTIGKSTRTYKKTPRASAKPKTMKKVEFVNNNREYNSNNSYFDNIPLSKTVAAMKKRDMKKTSRSSAKPKTMKKVAFVNNNREYNSNNSYFNSIPLSKTVAAMKKRDMKKSNKASSSQISDDVNANDDYIKVDPNKKYPKGSNAEFQAQIMRSVKNPAFMFNGMAKNPYKNKKSSRKSTQSKTATKTVKAKPSRPLKPCKEGQVRNLETNRCRKIQQNKTKKQTKSVKSTEKPGTKKSRALDKVFAMTRPLDETKVMNTNEEPEFNINAPTEEPRPLPPNKIKEHANSITRRVRDRKIKNKQNKPSLFDNDNNSNMKYVQNRMNTASNNTKPVPNLYDNSIEPAEQERRKNFKKLFGESESMNFSPVNANKVKELFENSPNNN